MPNPERWTPVPGSIEDLPPEEITLPPKPERHLRLVEDKNLKLETKLQNNKIEDISELRFHGEHKNVASVVCIQDDGKGVFKSKYGEAHITEGIEAGTYFRRERAAYLVDQFLGFGLVPPTVIRKVEGEDGSIQQFRADAMHYEHYDYKMFCDRRKFLTAQEDPLVAEYDKLKEVYSRYEEMLVELYKIKSFDELDALKKLNIFDQQIEEDQRAIEKLEGLKESKQRFMDEITKKLLAIRTECENYTRGRGRAKEAREQDSKKDMIKLWLFDMVIQNSDRHQNNYMLSTEDGGVIAIDNGTALGGSEFRFARPFFNEEIPTEIANILLGLQDRVSWNDKLREQLQELLSQQEIKDCIRRIYALIRGLEKQLMIPNSKKIKANKHYYKKDIDIFRDI